MIIFNAYRLRSAHEILLDSNQQEVQLDDKKIEITTSIKYLGSIISDDLSNRPHLNKRIRAAQSSLARVDLLGFNQRMYGLDRRCTTKSTHHNRHQNKKFYKRLIRYRFTGELLA